MAKGRGLMTTKAGRGLTIGLAVSIIGVGLLFSGALEALENATWDLRVQLLAKPSEATDDVILVLVDQQSLDQAIDNYNISWPWPRSVYSYIVDFSRQAGVASLTFDLILQDQGEKGPADDNQLLFAAQDLGRFVYGVQLDTITDNPYEWPDYVPRPDIAVSGLESLPPAVVEKMHYNRASFPHPDVTAPDTGLGFVNGENDKDGVYRRYQLLRYHGERPVPSLAIAAFAARNDDSVTIDYEKHFATVNGIRLPIDKEGAVLLKYTTPPGPGYPDDPTAVLPRHQTYSAWDILQSELALQAGVEPVVDPTEFEGKYVLFGLEAAGLFDLRPTSVDSRAPGVTVHATMLDNLLSGEVMRDFPIWASILFLLVVTFGAAIAATYAERTLTEALLILGFLAVLVALSGAGYLVGYWFPLVVPMVTVVLALVSANVANYATEGAQRRQIRGMFGRYLSPAVISQLEENPENLELGGEEREISIYFSDIQKFSTISKDLGDPKKLTSFLNDYLTPMTNIILEEGGTIDKYEGDAVIAFWGAPVEQPDHAKRALRAVMRCQAALDEMRDEFRERLGKDVYQRIGLNTGMATVGNMGSEARFDYTMIGDAVNLAARLEGANKAFGTYTMVSKETLDETDGLYPVRELGNIGVVGREDKPVRIFEPMQPAEYEKRAGAIEVYHKALKLFYEGQFAEAKKIFERLAEADPPSASYVARCDFLLANPPADWNGAWVLTEKG